MSRTKTFLFVVVVLIIGIGGCLIIANWIVPTTKGDGFDPNQNVERIVGVSMLKENYFVNQPLDLEWARLELKLKDGREISIALKEEYITNFDTTKTGNFVLKIKYFSFEYDFEYSVNYKKIEVSKDISLYDFEINEIVDLDSYFIDCFDYLDTVVEKIPFSETRLSNFSTETITQDVDRTATIVYNGLNTSFQYSVFYFSGKTNYVGKVTDLPDGFDYEITEFLPANEGKITIVKRISSNDLIESVNTYNLKRIDTTTHSIFLDKKAIVKMSYEGHKLIILKNAFSNESDIEVVLEKQDKIEIVEPIIKSIENVKNIKQNYFLNESVSFENLSLTLKLTDDTTVDIAIDKNNISNFSVDNVGIFTMKISYFKYNFYLNYNVMFKKIEFYTSNPSQIFTFSLNDETAMNGYNLICYDFYDNPVEIRNIGEDNVTFQMLDVSTTTVFGESRKATILCFGAYLEFEYIVV